MRIYLLSRTGKWILFLVVSRIVDLAEICNVVTTLSTPLERRRLIDVYGLQESDRLGDLSKMVRTHRKFNVADQSTIVRFQDTLNIIYFCGYNKSEIFILCLDKVNKYKIKFIYSIRSI